MDATTKRILELATEGLNDNEISDKLSVEGYKNDKGKPFNSKSVYSRRLRAQKNAPESHAKRSETSDVSDDSFGPSGTPDISDITPLPEAWRTEIIEIVRQEIQSMIQDQTIPTPQTEAPDLPPMPSEKIKGEHGKPINPGKRVKVAGTVDAELERLFQKWRESKGITLSRALDVALWHFLGKPKLSFEVSELSEISDDESDA
jgi:hypothetical protein